MYVAATWILPSFILHNIWVKYVKKKPSKIWWIKKHHYDNNTRWTSVLKVQVYLKCTQSTCIYYLNVYRIGQIVHMEMTISIL